MATVKDVLRAKIDRLRERRQRLLDEVAGVQTQIDALQAERDLITPATEARLDRLQQLLVIKADD